MKKELPKLPDNPFDDLFSTEEERVDAQLEKIVKIPISEISDFKNHPFHVRMDEDMMKLIESVEENGVLVPALVRPNKDGNGYEMISGHRRKFALVQNGFDTIDAVIRDLDDDQATIIMVDSNIQRERILPTERGYAYKLRLEAMKHQGKRVDLTSDQLEPKFRRTNQQLASEVGESVNQIKRYIRLTYLIKPLQNMVDGIDENRYTIALNPAYELSFLTEQEQTWIADLIPMLDATPSLAQCQDFKRKSQSSSLDLEYIEDVLSNEKPNQKEKISFKMEEVNKYFPKKYTPKQKKDTILKLLDQWHKKREREDVR